MREFNFGGKEGVQLESHEKFCLIQRLNTVF